MNRNCLAADESMTGVYSRWKIVAVGMIGLAGVAAMTEGAGIEWRGTIAQKSGTMFALYDSATGVSKWVKLKGEFETYSVSQYDAGKGYLVLSRDGVETHLTPSDAEYVAPAPAPSPVAANDLSGLSGLPLAEALVVRGDTALAKLLEEERHEVLRREDLARRLAAQERVLREALASGGRSPANQAAIDADRELNRLRTDAGKADSKIVELINTITLEADRKRNVLNTTPH